ncbi:hypothetical protein E5P60_06660 [Helicobacter pylori]|nr:hypothetical protein E5P60_06660 [Helicobacter pylori]
MIYFNLQEIKSLILDIESVASEALTPSKNYPMSLAVMIGLNKKELLC